MATKRSHIDIDPDYEDVTKAQTKRQKVLEEDGKHIGLHFFDIHQDVFQYDYLIIHYCKKTYLKSRKYQIIIVWVNYSH